MSHSEYAYTNTSDIMKQLIRVTTIILGAWVCGAMAGEGQGNWLQFRGDRALTGRSALKGHIHSPAVLWHQFIGARETLLTLSFSGDGETTIPLPDTDLHAEGWG